MVHRGGASRKRSPATTSEADEELTARPSSKRRRRFVPPYRSKTEDAAATADDAVEFGSVEYQRLSWNALRKSITGLVNKATAANVRHVAPELLAENLVRGRGLLCRALLKSQAACHPSFTDVFAALAAVVNSRLPCVGRLLLARLVLHVRRAHANGNAHQLATAAAFVAHDLLALEILALLLHRDEHRPLTEGAVEVAVGFVRECGAALAASCPRALDAVFDALRGVLHDGDGVDKRVQFMIEDLFAVRKSGFRGHPPVRPELDLIEHDDQVTHQVELDSDELDPELHLNVFQPRASFAQDEAAYEGLKKTILGDESQDPDHDQCSSSDDDDGGESSGDETEEPTTTTINDATDTDLINLRRTIYLTLMSSVGSEEAGHKLLSVVRPGQEHELCAMLVECCRKEKSSTGSFYGRLAQRLCTIARAYQAGFEDCFAGLYAAAHHMGTDELRASAGLYAHLLAADSLPWRAVLGRVRVTEDDTTSSSRIFFKLLFQDLAENLGIRELSRRMNDDEDNAAVRDALFPTDCARNTRFAINFFTTIALGGVTQSARKLLIVQQFY